MRDSAAGGVTNLQDSFGREESADDVLGLPTLERLWATLGRTDAVPRTGHLEKALSDAQCSHKICPDPVLLFRYSALTFNGHRVHYDHPYSTGVEGCPGLIVHGPLSATLLVFLAGDGIQDARVTGQAAHGFLGFLFCHLPCGFKEGAFA